MKYMMKRYLISLILAIIILTILGGCGMLSLIGKVFETEGLSNCTISYMSNGVLVTESLDPADEQTILNILDGKKMFKDNLSCGFSERASMNFNNNAVTLYFSQDSCGYVYYVNEEKYIAIGEKEKKTLYDILFKYGMTFPCV